MKKVTIYSLSDPITKEIKYIGKTTKKLSCRLNEHLLEPSNNLKKIWIQELLSNNLLPVIEEIESCSIDLSDKLEQYWIFQFKSWNFKLLNLTNGGKGSLGYKMPKEVKDKISTNHKNNLFFKNGSFKGKRHNETSIKKMSIVKLGKSRTLESRIKQSISCKGRKPCELSIINMIKIHGKRIIQLDKNYNKINWFYTIKEASTFLNPLQNKTNGHIVQCCQGKRKSAYGFIWKYEEDYLNEFSELPKATDMTEQNYLEVSNIKKYHE